ncbi:Mu transposase C-terminal domain-containing protein [Nitrospira defluvii]|uniref:Transposon Tn7 transposition protein TnsB n=1 Tax=Nitrospira defluvii TaxID=330214 RepID=A0ABN7MA21_9BACT|nr:Mu transposase C-terminal domain-containing protein [Nitrospira defluvii]CAE6794009.1 Putative Transposon Tn7 transposition protein TnsB [Nitrospira defluvii]
MQLYANRVIGWKGEKDGQPHLIKERILYIYPDQTASVINLNKKRPLPIRTPLKYLYDAFVNEDLVLVEEDPYTEQYRDEATLSENDKAFRSHVWDKLELFLTKHYLALLELRTRGAIVLEIIKSTGWTKETVYKYLRRYWLTGQTKNAFLPGYHRCGGRGGRRLVYDSRPGPERRNKQLGWTAGNGVAVNEDIRKRLTEGIKEFHLKQKLPFAQAVKKTIQSRFCDDFEMKNGIVIPKLWAPDSLPSERQARYLFKRDFQNPTQVLTALTSEKLFLRNHRALLGESLSMVEGPGSLYHIDATVGDVYLRSELDRNRLIGRPVIYLVVDVFSRMIVGFAVLLEGPSWMGAMQALFQAFSNKQRFCAGLGITITPNQWPCEGLPDAILADGGELLGHDADSLTALGIQIHQAAAWRPDWKPLVERYFGLLNTHIEWIPGKLHKRQPGEHDCRLDGVLTPRMFRQLLTWIILKHNNSVLLKHYALSKEMIADKVKRYPSVLWEWGVSQSLSELRWKPEPLVQATLLPRDKATVTRKGIRFKHLYYTCSLAESEQWFVRAGQKTWSIDVAYYPPDDSVLYLRLEDGSRLVPCTLVDRINELSWVGQDWYDVEDHFTLRNIENLDEKYTAAHSTLTFDVQEAALIKQAKEELAQAVTPTSKSSQLKGIADNYKKEREQEQQINPPVPKRVKPPLPPPQVSVDDEYIPDALPFALLQEAQAELTSKITSH